MANVQKLAPLFNSGSNMTGTTSSSNSASENGKNFTLGF